jgi:Flp pilus assembly protein TadG
MLLTKKLLRSERGNTMMIVAAVMPMLVGAGAIGIDVAQWALTKRHLQRMADTGAIAGANAVLQKGVAKPSVDRSLEHNDQISATTVVVENAPTAGTYAGDAGAVRVIVSASPQLSFVSMFMSGPTTLTAEATAKAMKDPRYCMIALEDGMQPGFDFSGSSGVEADCGIMTNSRAKPAAITFGGSAAMVKASEVGAVGGLGTSNWATGTKLLPYQAKLQDPYSYAPEANTFIKSPCNSSPAIVEGNQWTNRNLSEGCWTGGLTIKTSVTLNAGTYVIRGGTLAFTAGANVTATGPVTFVLTGDTPTTIAKLSITGNSQINLTAPTSGSLKDILFYQDRRAKYLSTENVLTGNSTSVFGGAFYFPTSNIHFTGNSDSTPVCARIVALRMSFTGNAQANISCGSSIDKLLGESVRLVA